MTHNLEAINKFNENTLIRLLDIRITKVGDDFITGTMPITSKVHQPFGVLHGGASCVFAESLGSIGSNLFIDQAKEYAVGQSIDAKHIRSAKDGELKGTAKIIHRGRRSHIWQIEIKNSEEKLICSSSLTMAIIEK